MPPVRPNLISRPRLLESLTQSFENRLILLSAPAGFGKTTLLSEWLATHPCPAGWLSLDRGDNDPVRFWTYLIAALRTIQPGLGESAQALLCTAPASPMESVLTVLINDLHSMAGHAVLVLDDYHAIDSPVIHSTLAFFLDHLPTGVHVVIATRVDPPLALAHLRAQGRLLELRVDKLRFTLEETAEFLNQRMALSLSVADIETLAGRTEGWVVGLQLAALSLKGRSDASAFIQALSGSHRYILDYLVEEVLSLQPGDIQTFLLQTCILERLCGSLCDALMVDETSPGAMEVSADSPGSTLAPIVRIEGQTEQGRIRSSSVSGQTILEYLERANLFLVPLDEERKWYRYHHLFADLLRARLVQSFGDGHLETLHRRAARWYEENRFLAEAIEHALAAHETERAGRLIEEIADSAWLCGEFYQVLRWIEALPGELMCSRPWLCVWYAWSRLQAGTVHGVEELIDHAERAARAHLDKAPAPGLAQDEALMEQIAALRVTCAGLRQETDKTIELAGRALERPVIRNQAASLMARSNVLNVLGFAYYVRGELSQAEQAYREARRVAQESDFVLRELLVVHKLAHIHQVMGRLLEPYQLYKESLAHLQEQGRGAFFAAGYLYCGLSHLLYEWNRLDEARQMLTQSLRLNELAQVPHLTIDTRQAQARLFLAQRDVDAAQTALQEAAHLIQKHYCWPEVVSANECLQARLWLTRGDMQSAARWVERCRPEGSEPPDFLRERSEITRARVLLAQGLLDEAVSLLGRLASAAEASARTGRLIEILALQGLGLSMIRTGGQKQDTTRPELRVLERSLALAKSEGYLRLFLDEGPSMATLLRQAAARGIEPDYVQELLDAFAVQACAERPTANGIPPSSGQRRVSSSLVEPLTERELEVLRLVAEGLSNREIAERLVVAIGTVKVHIHNICGKLDVQNRTQAILRAQQLGLLT
jgi:LuxR family maltose regulon positive regulatory protein